MCTSSSIKLINCIVRFQVLLVCAFVLTDVVECKFRDLWWLKGTHVCCCSGVVGQVPLLCSA